MSDPEDSTRLHNMVSEQLDAVRRRLCGTSAHVHALFCLACADRLLPWVQAYSQASNDDVSVFFLWTQSLFELLIDDEAIPVVPLTLLRDVRRAVPDEEEHDTPWTGIAHLGFWCLLCAIQSLHDSDWLYPEWSADCALYAAILVTKSKWEQRGRVGPEHAYDDVFIRELEKQRADIDFLTTATNLTPKDLHKWRLDNRGFAMPVMPQVP